MKKVDFDKTMCGLCGEVIEDCKCPKATGGSTFTVMPDEEALGEFKNTTQRYLDSLANRYR